VFLARDPRGHLLLELAHRLAELVVRGKAVSVLSQVHTSPPILRCYRRYETDLLYLAALIALCLGGAGPLSVMDF